MEFWKLMALGTALLGVAGVMSGSLLPGVGLLAISVYAFRTARSAG